MPSRQRHLEFDEVLKENEVIFKDTDGNSVHDRMDKRANNYGANHRVKDPFHSPMYIPFLTEH